MSGTGSRTDSLRRVVGVICTLTLLSLAIGYYQYGPGLAAALSDPKPKPPVAATESTAAAPTPTNPSSSPTSAAATPRPPSPTPSTTRTTPAKPPKGMPAGPGTTEPGILLVAAPDADGRFAITELVRLAAPVTVLQLRPLNVRAAGPGLRAARPIATDIELTADGRPVKL